jgi:hypothetical protein
MYASPVDPRINRWEVDQPAYRVTFWQQSSSPSGAGWTSDEWRLTEADVHEVLAWVDDQANGRRVTVWVDLAHDGEPGLVRLSGWEPTRAGHPSAWVRH